MNYSCLSCRAKYQMPDERVAAAGASGLRVRCTRCRAIMVVTSAMAQTRSADAPRAPAEVARAPSPPARAASPTTAMTTGVMQNPFAHVAAPAGGDAGGRAITGVFIPLLASLDEKSEGAAHFHVAIDGRARGPYTAKVLIMLADKGKVRAGTLVWRPGASTWRPLKHVTEFDVSWLRDAVARRKRREQEAERDALSRRGIAPVRLERASIGNRLPPPMPADVDVQKSDAWSAALHDAPSTLPQDGASSFVWRAPSARSVARRPGAVSVRHVAAIAVVVTVAGLAAASFAL